MGRGSTGLDNYDYDRWLSKNKKAAELKQRHAERRAAHKADGSGYHFGIDEKPVKTRDMNELRRELDKRGLAIKDEYKGKRRW